MIELTSLLRKTSGLIEYIDTEESNNAFIAIYPNQLNDKDNKHLQYTHCEIHPMLIFGVLGSIIPFIDSANVTMSFSSSFKIYETQYQCTINENEFNYSLNPSIISGSQIVKKFSGSDIINENTASIGKPQDFVTGSYFSPYITTVGLYDKDYQLLAVGKLAQPLQSSPTTDTTILVNMDR